jgi:hypothetical protein
MVSGWRFTPQAHVDEQPMMFATAERADNCHAPNPISNPVIISLRIMSSYSFRKEIDVEPDI